MPLRVTLTDDRTLAHQHRLGGLFGGSQHKCLPEVLQRCGLTISQSNARCQGTRRIPPPVARHRHALLLSSTARAARFKKKFGEFCRVLFCTVCIAKTASSGTSCVSGLGSGQPPPADSDGPNRGASKSAPAERGRRKIFGFRPPAKSVFRAQNTRFSPVPQSSTFGVRSHVLRKPAPHPNRITGTKEVLREIRYPYNPSRALEP